MKTSQTLTVTEFETIDHGIHHAQYFQGCGVSYTAFDHIVTGCGGSASEAWDDALEQIATSHDIDLASLEASEDHALFTSKEAQNASVEKHLEKMGEEMEEDCELYYYVSIRYNVATLAPVVFVPVLPLLV